MKIKPYNLKKTVLPSALIFSPLFSIVKNSKERKIISFKSQRTKFESLEYRGFELDCNIDFKLYALIISKYLRTEELHVSLTKNEIFETLNTSKSNRHNKTFLDYLKRIVKFKYCEVTLNHDIGQIDKEDVEVYTLSFYLIKSMEYDNESESIKIYLDYDFNTEYFNRFSKSIVCLEKFSKIKTLYNKSLYLMFLTLKFQERRYYHIKTENLTNRICRNLNKSESNRVLKRTLSNLVTLGYISGYELNKNSNSVKIFNNFGLTSDELI
ncbi:hypothetical protein [Shewanella xiamenensis]|uniref:hypothetical protein n=1 Tax=Shewanella xiamenensis TaxID=332186 RepID=UPI00313C81D7